MVFWALQTINDVVMGVSLAGLSRYLNRRYGKLPLILSSISLPTMPLNFMSRNSLNMLSINCR